MAAMSDRLPRAVPFNSLKPFERHRFADLVAARFAARRLISPLFTASITRSRKSCEYGFTISCWPPPSQQVESDLLIRDPDPNSTQAQRALASSPRVVPFLRSSPVPSGTVAGIVTPPDVRLAEARGRELTSDRHRQKRLTEEPSCEAEDMTMTHDQRSAELALDQRATSRHGGFAWRRLPSFQERPL